MVIFKTVFLACIFFSCVISYSQTVSIDTDITAQELIETHLFEGCIEISNVHTEIDGSVIGLSSFGTFSKSNSNFPFSEGIVLSTGNANSAGNTIITENLNEGNANWGTDSDLLDELGITNSLNATSIEFDFISAIDKVRFEYIFTSEEYLQSEYVCDKNDIFVLLIREVSSTGPYINIATVGPQNNLITPGTIHPVKGELNNNIFSNKIKPLNKDYFKTLWSRFKKQFDVLEQGQTLYSFRHSGAIEIFRRTGSLTKLQKAMGHSGLNVSLTYLRGLEVAELKEEDMPMV